jgi:3-(3-hydroxy-phenyl)propionate hydroxylase
MNTNTLSHLPAETDVLVVGFGPVGAALAALLGRQGVQALVIDKVRDVMLMPRAIALDNEALRILQMAGLDESAFERIDIPEVRMHCPLVGEFGRVNTAGSLDGHPKLVTFYQPDLERALRCEVEKFPQVTVRCGHELTRLDAREDGVLATVQGGDGSQHQVFARYLVGADGASSRVRTLIGQDFQGQTYAEDWLIVDAAQRTGRAIDHVEFLCDPRRPTPHMPAPGGRERWEFMLRRGERAEDMLAPARIAELLAPWVRSDDLVIERKAVYRFHARCCDKFSEGRVFLVGDAAHITPPFVGQGLVAGLRDAANLAWKLAWVVKGHATPALLASYDQERRPHARKMIQLAKLMGRLVMPRSRLSAVLVHGAMRGVGLVPPARRYLEELRIKPANRFRRGFFMPGRGGGSLRRGGQLPQGQVRQAGLVHGSDDVLGDGMVLVGFGVDPGQLLDAQTRARWAARGGTLLQFGTRCKAGAGTTRFCETLGDTPWQGMPRDWLVVVRPDRVVLHDGPADSARRLVAESLRLLDS